MRSAILSFALTSFYLFSLIDQSLAGSPFRQESDDPQLRTLLETRRNTVKELVELVKLELEIGHPDLAALSAANLLLAEAELETAGSPAERIACFERALEAHNEIERQVEARAKYGTAKAADLLLTRAARLKAEVELYEARIDLNETEEKASLDGNAEMRKTNDAAIQRLLETRYDTLKGAAQLIQFDVEVGSGSIETVFRVNELLLEAASEPPDRSEAGIAIFEDILAYRTKVEEQFHVYWKANNLHEKDFHNAKADREMAAINLHRAKKGKWPGRIGRNYARAPVTEEEPIDPELQTLLVEQRDTLKTIRRLVEKDGKIGVARIGDMINANNAYFNAELELAKSPQEQEAFLQEALKMQTEVERVAAERHIVGTLRLSEYLPAKAARLKVEVELHRARKRTK